MTYDTPGTEKTNNLRFIVDREIQLIGKADCLTGVMTTEIGKKDIDAAVSLGVDHHQVSKPPHHVISLKPMRAWP